MANVEGQRHEGAQQNHWHVWLTVQPRVLVGGREALLVAIPTKGRVSGQLSMGRIAIPRCHGNFVEIYLVQRFM